MQNIMIPLASAPGQLAKLTRIMAEGDVDIRSLDADDDASRDFGVVRIVVDRYDHALQLLRSAGYSPITEDALLIQVVDEPGSLARIVARFSDVGLNVKSIHILHRREGESLVSLVTDDNQAARRIVADCLVDPHP
jgi:hypothetical protein